MVYHTYITAMGVVGIARYESVTTENTSDLIIKAYVLWVAAVANEVLSEEHESQNMTFVTCKQTYLSHNGNMDLQCDFKS